MKKLKKTIENHLEKVFKKNDKQINKILKREKEKLKKEGYILKY